jgi:hypothetical protein
MFGVKKNCKFDFYYFIVNENSKKVPFLREFIENNNFN